MRSTNNTSDDLLEQAITATKESAVGERPPAHVLTATRAALDAAATPATLQRRSHTIEAPTARSRWSSFAFAATLLLAIGITSLLWNSDKSAFAAVLAQIARSPTVGLNVSTKLGSGPALEGRMLLDDAHLRVEWFEGKLVTIADFTSQRSVVLDNTQKTAQLTKLNDKMITAFSGVIESLRNAKPADAKPLGQQTLDGRSTDVFEVRNGTLLGMSRIAEMRVWVDHETQLPIMIVAEDPDPKAEMRMVFQDMQWGIEIPAAQFALATPAGYRQLDTLAAADSRVPIASTSANTPAGATMLSSDRVPRSIVWDKASSTLTALMTDSEKIDLKNHRSNEIRQWDMSSKKLRWSKPVQSGSMLASAPAESILAFAIGREIQIVSASDGELRSNLTSKFALPALSLSPSGKVLATAGADWQSVQQKRPPNGLIEVWDVVKNEKLRDIVDDALTTFVLLAPDGQSLVSSSNSGPVKLWRISDGKLMHIFDGLLRAAFAPSGQQLAVVSQALTGKNATTSLALYQMDDFSLVRKLDLPQVKSSVLSVAFSPDEQALAVGSWDGHLIIWDLAQPNTAPIAKHIDGGIHALAFSPDGKQLASGSEDGALLIWDLE